MSLPRAWVGRGHTPHTASPPSLTTALRGEVLLCHVVATEREATPPRAAPHTSGCLRPSPLASRFSQSVLATDSNDFNNVFVGSSLVVPRVKDPVLSLWRLGSLMCLGLNPWCGNCHRLHMRPKNRSITRLKKKMSLSLRESTSLGSYGDKGTNGEDPTEENAVFQDWMH